MIYEGRCVDCKEKIPTLTWNISRILDSGEIVSVDVNFTAFQGRPLKVNLSDLPFSLTVVTISTVHTLITIKLL